MNRPVPVLPFSFATRRRCEGKGAELRAQVSKAPGCGGSALGPRSSPSPAWGSLPRKSPRKMGPLTERRWTRAGGPQISGGSFNPLGLLGPPPLTASPPRPTREAAGGQWRDKAGEVGEIPRFGSGGAAGFVLQPWLPKLWVGQN